MFLFRSATYFMAVNVSEKFYLSALKVGESHEDDEGQMKAVPLSPRPSVDLSQTPSPGQAPLLVHNSLNHCCSPLELGYLGPRWDALTCS